METDTVDLFDRPGPIFPTNPAPSLHMSQPSSSSPVEAQGPENVFLFIPNLIGYTRVLLWLLSLFYLNTDPLLAMGYYGASCLMDALDGHAARLYNQSSRFGAVLDMVTDRSSTAALIVYLATVYPTYTVVFQVLIALDLSSHYMQMYASLTSGRTSHKTMSPSTPWIMRMYYTDRMVLFGVCLANEAFFMALYLMSAGVVYWLALVVAMVSGPICLFKQVVNVIQLVEASQTLASMDLESRAKGKERAE
ncbi:phosphatidylinositol synthase [Entophlyctis helioformis]|nr:phosphatidylinositol synthase [Entophlyctis helioformis]